MLDSQHLSQKLFSFILASVGLRTGGVLSCVGGAINPLDGAAA